MVDNLFSADKFCIITFPSTQSAIKAERFLTENGEKFILIPTPRELTANCGLAVKCYCEDIDKLLALLAGEGIEVGGSYLLSKNGSKNLISILLSSDKK